MERALSLGEIEPYEPDLFHLSNEEDPPVGLSNIIDNDLEWNEEDGGG